MATSKAKKSARRGRTPLPAGMRKDRLIQTRVGDSLADALRRESEGRRMTVSQLVRVLLEDALGLRNRR